MTYRIRETDADNRPVGTLSYCADPAWDARLRAAGQQGREAAARARAEAAEAGAFRHVNPGDEVSDLPEASVEWLLRQGYIEPVESQETDPVAEPEADPVPEQPSRSRKGRGRAKKE
jgi:hypothetical protein